IAQRDAGQTSGDSSDDRAGQVQTSGSDQRASDGEQQLVRNRKAEDTEHLPKNSSGAPNRTSHATSSRSTSGPAWHKRRLARTPFRNAQVRGSISSVRNRRRRIAAAAISPQMRRLHAEDVERWSDRGAEVSRGHTRS